jgi:hypothetical protein
MQDAIIRENHKSLRRSSMKRIFFINIILLLFAVSSGYAYDRGHSWDGGVVDSIYEGTYKVPDSRGGMKDVTYDMMIISGEKYVVDADCEFFELYKEGSHGSVNRRRIRHADINEGDTVTIKRIGRTLIEISREER